MSYRNVEHYDYSVQPKMPTQSTNYGWIAFAIIIFIIIVIIIILIFFYERGVTTESLSHTWIFRENSTSGNISYIGDGGTILTNSASSNVVITLSPPATNPVGQEFIIDNLKGGGSVTIANGITAIPTNIVAKGKVSSYVWQTSTSLIRLY